ncbi:MAG: tetratricopeptide repeat protein [Planctomycetota bacterium]|nr:tetratricopeptide repeat protein [Planctomycetota bacterium]
MRRAILHLAITLFLVPLGTARIDCGDGNLRAESPKGVSLSPARGVRSNRSVGAKSQRVKETPAGTGGADQLPQVAEQLRQAYQLAQRAKTIEQFSQALRICEQALGQSGITADQRQYAQHLSSWLSNKRGEAYSAQAEDMAHGDDSSAEDSLERNALRDFERAVKFNPEAWRPLHNRGVSRAILRDYEASLEDFAAALQRNPRYVNTWFNRAEVLYELGEYEKAVADYTRAIRLDPNDADAHVNRGHANFQLGNYQRSLEDYDRVLQLRPDDAVAHIDRADAYAFLGEWSKSASDYRIAIRLDNQQPRAYQNAAWLMATCPDDQFRNPALAVRAAKRAIELSGESDHRSLDILGAAQASAGQFNEAQQAVVQAMHGAPEGSRGPLESRLELYKRQEPYRQPRPVAASSVVKPE